MYSKLLQFVVYKFCMIATLDAAKVRTDFSKKVKNLKPGDSLIVNKNGQGFVAVVPMQDWQKLQEIQEKEKLQQIAELRQIFNQDTELSLEAEKWLEEKGIKSRPGDAGYDEQILDALYAED